MENVSWWKMLKYSVVLTKRYYGSNQCIPKIISDPTNVVPENIHNGTTQLYVQYLGPNQNAQISYIDL